MARARVTIADAAIARLEVLRQAEGELARRRANNPEDIARRQERKRQSTRGWIDDDGILQGGLMAFIRWHWHILEPQTELAEGWALYAIVMHLEAVTFGEITRLLINVPPGFMKSLTTNVFWPAWEWGPMGMSHLRYVAFSYAISLTERDNEKFRDLILSSAYQELWGQVFRLVKIGSSKITNDKTGWKLASSIGGVGTGERGDRVLGDDLHNVKEAESDTVRSETVRWTRESMSDRLNDVEFSAIALIMQRVHETDTSGMILEVGLPYVHLMIPMEYDPTRHCTTAIEWTDPRTEDGELAWEDRFSPVAVADLKMVKDVYAYAGQYQQEPITRGGGIFQRAWWQMWEPGSEEAKAIAKHEDGKWPPFEYVLGSLDGAYTEKEANDPTAMTVWGVFRNKLDHPKIALVHAWRKRLIVHGPVMPIRAGETRIAHLRRTQPHWGVVEWAAHTCRVFKVDLLLIEAKASGISVGQSIQSLYGDEGFATQLEKVKGDKVARAQAITPFFSNAMVFAHSAQKEEMPGDQLLFRDWAQMVIDEMAVFPKGRYDDLTDTASQALRHLRARGFARMESEVETDKANAMRYKPRTRQLYPGSRV
jgi:predicted phage terminase large subunit-like protein